MVYDAVSINCTVYTMFSVMFCFQDSWVCVRGGI